MQVLIALSTDLDRHGLRHALDGGELSVVGQAGTGEAALALLDRDRPDVIVVDALLPDMSGIELTSRLLSRRPDLRVLLYTEPEEEAVLEALAAGAAGCVARDSSLKELIDAIRTARAGMVALPLEMVAKLARRLQVAPPGGVGSADLSERELAVLLLLAAGMENERIGLELSVSPTTVKRHISRILEKLGVTNRVQAAVYAVRTGLVDA
jgi:DNA-binding NarL/FixJ family response regulator